MITKITTTKKTISMRTKKKTSRKQQQTSPNNLTSSRRLTIREKNSWISSTMTSRKSRPKLNLPSILTAVRNLQQLLQMRMKMSLIRNSI
jgi:hypothetical protein